MLRVPPGRVSKTAYASHPRRGPDSTLTTATSQPLAPDVSPAVPLGAQEARA